MPTFNSDNQVLDIDISNNPGIVKMFNIRSKL
jgi:hypothetical protein